SDILILGTILMAPGKPPVLNYGSTSRRALFRQLARRALWITFLVLAIISVRQNAAGAWRAATRAYWLRQCKSYNPTPQTVVYEEVPDRAAALTRSDSRCKPFIPFAPLDAPRDWTAPVGVVFEPFQRMMTSCLAFSGADGHLLFLHILVTPSGERRFVV